MSASSSLTPQILLYQDMLYLAAAYRRTKNETSSGFLIDTKDCTARSRSAKMIRIQLPISTYFKGYQTSYQISGELQALLRDEVCKAIRSELETQVKTGLVEAGKLESIVKSSFESLMRREFDETAIETYMQDDVPQKQVSDVEGRTYTVVRST